MRIEGRSRPNARGASCGGRSLARSCILLAVTVATLSAHRQAADAARHAHPLAGGAVWLLAERAERTPSGRVRVIVGIYRSLLAAGRGTMFPVSAARHFRWGRGGISIFAASPSPVATDEVRWSLPDRRHHRGRRLRPDRHGGAWRERSASNEPAVDAFVANVLAGYDRSRLTLCFDRKPLGARSGVRRARARPAQLVVTAKGRERTYSEHLPCEKGRCARGCVDEVIELDAFADIMRDDVQRRLLDANVDLRPQPLVRSLSAPAATLTRRSSAACACRFFGNRSLLKARAEERRGRRRRSICPVRASGNTSPAAVRLAPRDRPARHGEGATRKGHVRTRVFSGVVAAVSTKRPRRV